MNLLRGKSRFREPVHPSSGCKCRLEAQLTGKLYGSCISGVSTAFLYKPFAVKVSSLPFLMVAQKFALAITCSCVVAVILSNNYGSGLDMGPTHRCFHCLYSRYQ